MDNKKNQKKKKSPFGGVIALIILMSLASEFGENLTQNRSVRVFVRRIQSWLFFHGVDPELLDLVPWVLVALVILLVVAVVKAVARGRRAVEDKPPVASRTAAARRDPRSASFTRPEAHCVSCELSGDDHFARDKAQRIAQLDEWLKNGLIEKDEYRILKKRYTQE